MSDIFTLKDTQGEFVAQSRYPMKINNDNITVSNKIKESILRLEKNSSNGLELYYDEENNKTGLRLNNQGEIVDLITWNSEGTGGGTNPFDQDLNTTNDVKFNSVKTNVLVSEFDPQRKIEWIETLASEDILSIAAPRISLGGFVDIGAVPNPGSTGISGIAGRLWNNGASPPELRWTTTTSQVDLTNPYENNLVQTGDATLNTLTATTNINSDIIITNNLNTKDERYINCDGTISTRNFELQPAQTIGLFDDPLSIGSIYMKPGDTGLYFLSAPITEHFLSWGFNRRNQEDSGPFSTTSNLFIPVGTPINYNTMNLGTYVVNWSVEISNTSRTRESYVRILWKQTGFPDVVIADSTKGEMGVDSTYTTASGIKVIDNVNDVVSSFEVEYRAENNTALLRNINILTYRIDGV